MKLLKISKSLSRWNVQISFSSGELLKIAAMMKVVLDNQTIQMGPERRVLAGIEAIIEQVIKEKEKQHEKQS